MNTGSKPSAVRSFPPKGPEIKPGVPEVKQRDAMKKLFAAADRYVETSDWKIIAVLKFCLISLGIMIGMQIKPKYKKSVFLGSLSVFAVTYVPLMTKSFRVLTGKE